VFPYSSTLRQQYYNPQIFTEFLSLDFFLPAQYKKTDSRRKLETFIAAVINADYFLAQINISKKFASLSILR